MKRSIALSSAIMFTIMLCLTACQIPLLTQTPSEEPDLPHVETDKPPVNDPEPVHPDPTTVTLAATGDIMMHSTQIKAAQNSDGSYDFRSVFSDVKPYFKAADLVYGNLETTLSGQEPYTGYPMFNAPDEVAVALKDAGFHIVQTANNHTMDTRAAGAVRTYEVLKEKGLEPVGTAATAADRQPLILEKNDIKLAFLAYTYGTNGIPIPEDQPHLVNLIDEDLIEQDISDAKAAGAEFIVVGLHYGNEYQREPTEEQRTLTRRVFEMGADVILGGHPHVLQPMERMDVNGEEKFVIYSLGNFVSNQFSYTISNPYANKGMILYIDIEKNYEQETVTVKDVRYLPTVVHRYEKNGTGYAIIPIEQQHIAEEVLNYDYPGLSFQMVQEAWEQTTTHMDLYESFPTFQLDEAEPVEQQDR